MDKTEIDALKKTGALAPAFKINSGLELDYQLAIAMVKNNKSKI